jgi:hypothetical protein
VLVRQVEDEGRVERPGEARVGHGDGHAVSGELFGRLPTFGEPRAERQQRDVVTLADDPSLANPQRPSDLRDGRSESLATRIPDRGRTVVDGDGGRDDVGKLFLLRRGHDDEARQTGEIGTSNDLACVGPSAPI